MFAAVRSYAPRPARHSQWSASLVLLIALAAALLVACGSGRSASYQSGTASASASSGTSSASTFPRTLTDSSGARLQIVGPPKRIVSLSPGATEILYAIGAGDRVVGSDQFSDFPAAAKQTAKIDYSKPDPERTLALNPDLVIMATRQREQVGQFRDLKMAVLYLEEPTSVQGVLDQVVQFGQITGQDQQAQALASQMRGRIDAVTTRLGNVTSGPRVFYELSPDLYTVAPDTFIGSMLTLLKAKNVATGTTTRFPQLSAEAVIAADPEVILLADAASASQDQNTVASRPGWSNLAAVQNKRIYPSNPDITNRPGPRIVEGLEEMAKALYPERFR